jgi:carbon storage regulator
MINTKMLILSRQRDESIMIGDNVEITIVDIRGDKVRLGITSPKHISVHRREIYDAIQREKAEKEKAGREGLFFCCSGAYGSDKTEQKAYIKAPLSGEKKLDCSSLHREGYCCLGNATNPLNKCPFGIEKFVG